VENESDDIVSIEDVQQLSSVSDETLVTFSGATERLRAMHSLQDGWLDGEGFAPSIDALARGEGLLQNLSASGSLAPYVYPTEDGGVQFEWSISSHQISVEIFRDGTAEMFDVIGGDRNNHEIENDVQDEQVRAYLSGVTSVE
jgi:hypothetical protein